MTEPSAPIVALHITNRGDAIPVNGSRSPPLCTYNNLCAGAIHQRHMNAGACARRAGLNGERQQTPTERGTNKDDDDDDDDERNKKNNVNREKSGCSCRF